MTEDRAWSPIELSPEHAPPAGAFSPAAPARAIVGAALEGFLIEVTAVAARPRAAETRR
jgi:hypothetical protein